MRARSPGFWLVVVLAVLAGGCGGPEVKAIKGQVRLDSAPLAGAVLEFWPKDEPRLGSFGGQTGSDGMSVIRPESRHGAAKPGRYVVLVTKPSQQGPLASSEDASPVPVVGPRANALPSIYGDWQRSPLIVEIKPGANDLPPLELTSRPGR